MSATTEDIVILGPCPPLDQMSKEDVKYEAYILDSCVQRVHESLDWLGLASRYFLVKPPSAESPWEPFRANYLQRSIRHDRVVKKIRRTKRTKARRAGSTTGECIAAQVYVLAMPNYNVVIGAPDIPAAKRIAIEEQIKPTFERVHPLALGLAGEWQIVERELRVTHRHKLGISKIWVAGFDKDQAAGVGFACQYAIGTEMAKADASGWSKFKDLAKAVPPSGLIAVESVAEGAQNDFYWFYAEDNTYHRQFFPWWTREDAILLPGPQNEGLGLPKELWGDFPLTEREREWQEQFGVRIDQLRFYRLQVLEDGPELTKQYFPSTWQEAFISTMVVSLPQEPLAIMELTSAPQMTAKMMTQTEKERALECGWRDNIPEKGEGLKIYRLPDHNRSYSLGIDSSYGEMDGDFSCIQVLDEVSGEQVAIIRGHYRADPLAEYAYRLWQWYSKAFIIPERNAVGEAICSLLEHRIPSQYLFHHDDKEGAGYIMTKGRKEELIANLSRGLDSRNIFINDAYTRRECRNFRKGKGGKWSAPDGMNDDAVMALVLAFLRRSDGQIGQLQPRRKPTVYAAG